MEASALDGGNKVQNWSQGPHEPEVVETATETASSSIEQQTGKPPVERSEFVRLAPTAAAPSPAEVFAEALGQPKTVEDFDRQMTAAVRATVNAPAGASDDEAYQSFNTLMNNSSADEKVDFFAAAFRASAYLPGEAEFKPLAFFSKIFEIQRVDGNVIPPQDKTAHQFGPGGVVGLEAQGNVPETLQGDAAIVRMAPGARSQAPGFSFVFPGDAGEANQARVLMSPSGDYNSTLSTSALGLKTEGPEGKLEFQPGEALKGLTLVDREGNPSEAWMQEVGKLPAGTVLGTLAPEDPSAGWSITVKTGEEPLTTNMMADRSLRFPRKVRPEGVLGWMGWGAAAAVLSPILLARAVIKAFAD